MTDLCPSCKEPLDYPSGDDCAAMTMHYEPRPGELRAVNYRVGVTEDGQPIYRHRLEQYHPAPWGIGKGQWKTIRVYDEGDDGQLKEVPQ
jgi:hypothetical protein